MKKMMKTVVSAMLLLLLAVTLLSGCGASADPQQTVATVNGEEIKYGVPAWHARYQQAQIHRMYTMYFGTSEIFDTQYDEAGERTYGDQMKDDIMEAVEELVVIRQHAADYQLTLSEEEEQKIAGVAAKTAADNGKAVLKSIGTDEACIAEILRLQTMRGKMLAALGKEKEQDIDIKEEEMLQSTVSYFKIEKASAEEEAAHEADEEHTHLTKEEAELQDQSRLADAETILKTMQEREDGATVDLSEVELSLASEFNTFTQVHYTTSDPSKEAMDTALIAAVEGLKDGELVDRVVESEDGTSYYVIRMDHVKDEAATKDVLDSTIASEKEQYFRDTVDGWMEDSEISVNESIWGKISLTDKEIYTLKAETSEEAQSRE